MKTKAIVILTILNCSILCHAQGFINLNFEAANLAAYGGGPAFISSTNALPGWTAYAGASQLNTIPYNNLSLGGTSVSIFDTNGFYSVISGAVSVNLYGGITDASASISQTGLIPASALTLLFKAQAGAGVLQVFLGGQGLSFFNMTSESNYNLYAADISSFANQIQTLTFSALNGNNNYWTIDDIQFSPTAIPEPSTLALAALGTLLLGFQRWKKWK